MIQVSQLIQKSFIPCSLVAINEPEIENSGIPQGKFLTRQLLPTGNGSEVLHWTKLNVAMDLLVYGKRIRINECDAFTREYLTSQGIEVNPNETAPADIFTQSRHQPAQTYTTPSYGIAKNLTK